MANWSVDDYLNQYGIQAPQEPDPWMTQSETPYDYGIQDNSTMPVAQPDPGDPWANLAQTYGLGAPPAQGMPATLPGVTVGAPPEMQFNQQSYLDLMNQINGQIGQGFNYNAPNVQAQLLDPGGMPQPGASQYGESAELQRLLNGEGYSPQTLARMRANAVEAPAQAGLQQMSQMRRALGDAGIEGGAAAAVQGDVARQTGYNQGQALRDVEIGNAQTANQNMQFGVGQQTNIGLSNMQQANQMAISNANIMFEALRSNQSASNSMNQFNAGMQGQKDNAQAQTQANFLGQQGNMAQQQRFNTDLQNNQNQWQQKQLQTNLDWEKQYRPWEELNKRYGQANNILGSMGQS